MKVEKGNINMLTGAFLNSFGIVNQFLQLVFSNDKYEEIKFFIDCQIRSNDIDINSIKEELDKVDSDVALVVLFIKANCKKVIKIEIIDNELMICFSNEYCVYFLLVSEDNEPLSISIREKLNDDSYYSIDFHQLCEK